MTDYTKKTFSVAVGQSEAYRDNWDRVFGSEKATKSTLPQAGEQWRHAKGGLYRVLMLGTIEATQVPAVVYQSEQDQRVWVRPLDNFCERFEKVE